MCQPDSRGPSDSTESESETAEPEDPIPTTRKFGSYGRSVKKKKLATFVRPDLQLQQYLDLELEEDLDPLEFWNKYGDQFPELATITRFMPTVPASSAPVERVFSHGGIICRPHRARLSDAHLSQLVFMKVNRLL